MSVHVKGCRCEACLEGRNDQHVAGCLCDDCKAREAALGGGSVVGMLRGLGRRLDRIVRAAKAVEEVLEPEERDVVKRFLRGRT